ADLVRLGNRILVAEEAAPTRPPPRAPDRPPWNKLVDPVLGVADKLRDVLTRRVTYPADL
ncbi:MAG: hemerythrin domain-containing protein, partial [Dactylosporangium sp.]|nr:hemerythrin domain-containing protein [Dactylosporangium sp.]